MNLLKNKKGAGFGSTVGAIVGGTAFVWLLVTLGGTGALLGASGSPVLIFLGIFLFVIWLLHKK